MVCAFFIPSTGHTPERRKHVYITKILTGLLTKEQLLNFPASNECSYHFEWVTNATVLALYRILKCWMKYIKGLSLLHGIVLPPSDSVGLVALTGN